MNLGEFMQKPLSEAIAEMELVDSKVHTNDAGQVQAVELKYRPKDVVPEQKPTPRKGW